MALSGTQTTEVSLLTMFTRPRTFTAKAEAGLVSGALTPLKPVRALDPINQRDI